MFCRNCGKELVGTPEICMNCGARPASAKAFCPACGAPTNAQAVVCVKCGASLEAKTSTTQVLGPVSSKSRLVLTLLAFFVGTIGIHRFYAGKTGTAITMLILGIIGWATIWLLVGVFFIGAVGLWALIDFIMAVAGSFKDKDGKVIANWNA
jgi:TM2 domain-containing membrane protein YozV